MSMQFLISGRAGKSLVMRSKAFTHARIDVLPIQRSFLGASPAIQRIETNAETGFREKRPVYSRV